MEFARKTVAETVLLEKTICHIVSLTHLRLVIAVLAAAGQLRAELLVGVAVHRGEVDEAEEHVGEEDALVGLGAGVAGGPAHQNGPRKNGILVLLSLINNLNCITNTLGSNKI